MVQGYKAQVGGSECFRPSFTAGRGEGKGDRPAAEGRVCPGGAHTDGPARKQRASLAAGEFKLRGPEASGREAGGLQGRVNFQFWNTLGSSLQR